MGCQGDVFKKALFRRTELFIVFFKKNAVISFLVLLEFFPQHFSALFHNEQIP